MQSQINNRRKTGFILVTASIAMLSPFVINLVWLRNPLFQDLGFSKDTVAPPASWISSLMLAAAFIFYTFKKIPFVLKMQREISILKLIGIFSAFAGGLLEEVIFRRWLMDFTMSLGYSAIIQIALSGIIFGLAHSLWFLFKREIRFAIPAVLSTSALGVGLAAIYVIGGRNLGPCIVAHVLINLIIEPWLMLSSVSGGWRIRSDG
jgi:membrane protease YdiL (CAAX protease family)